MATLAVEKQATVDGGDAQSASPSSTAPDGIAGETSNGKYKGGYSNLKDMIKRNKNEVSFEETISLLDGDEPPQTALVPEIITPIIDGLELGGERESAPPTPPPPPPPSRDVSSANLPLLQLPSTSTSPFTSISPPTSPSPTPPSPSADRRVFPQPGTPGTAPLKSILTNSTSNSGQTPKDVASPKRPPDGGWGWVVVFASFMMNLISDGVSLSFGLIFVELVDFFGESKSKTSWVGSLFLSIPLLTGPVASALTDHFGCRKVAIAGSFFASAGFVAGYFSSKIEWLYFAFSISGFGISLCQVTSIVCVAYYFEKRRSLATGLSVCGTGLGTFIFSPLTNYLLKTFQWQGALLILAFIFLFISVFALLIRDLDLDDDSESEESGTSSSSSSSADESTSDAESNLMDDSELNSIAEEDEDGRDEADYEAAGGRSSRLSSSRAAAEASDEDSEAGGHHCRRISFKNGGNGRMRHISECEAPAEPLTRGYASLINIPTYIKAAAAQADSQRASVQAEGGSGLNDSIGELTFRRGGYLHNLITYYPHLLSLFLPWNLECNDLTVKTVPDRGRSPEKTVLGQGEKADDAQKEASGVIDGAPEVEEGAIKCGQHQVDFTTPPPVSPTLPHNPDHSSTASLSHGGPDSVVIPVPTPPNYPEFKFAPTRRPRSASGRLARKRHFHTAGSHHHPSRHAMALHGAVPGAPGYLFGNYLHNLRLQRGSLTYRSAMLIISKYKLKASSAPDIYKTSMATINEDKGFSMWRNLKSILGDMFDLSLFRNVAYTIFCISNFLLYACVDIPYIYLPDQAITSGSFDKEGASLLISIIGVFNTIGVVLIGYTGDKPWLDASMIYAFFIALSGFALAAIPLTIDAALVSTYTAVYGFAISANYSLVSAILVELITLDSFTQAYGLLLLVQGVGSLIGPPIVGWLFDTLGTYNLAFYLTGGCVILSGFAVIPVGNRQHCFLWSYRLSKSGSGTSLFFKPTGFLAEGVYGRAVCSKRNVNPPVDSLRPSSEVPRGAGGYVPEMASLLGVGPTPVHSLASINGAPKSNGHHHVVIMDDERANGAVRGEEDSENQQEAKLEA